MASSSGLEQLDYKTILELSDNKTITEQMDNNTITEPSGNKIIAEQKNNKSKHSMLALKKQSNNGTAIFGTSALKKQIGDTILTEQFGNGTTAHGLLALKKQLETTIGRDNTAYGHEALENLGSNMNESTAFGSQALSDNVSGENSAFGAYSATKCAGTGNTALGSWCLRNVSGNNNTASGHRSMAGDNNEEKVSTPSVYGSNNTAYGFGTYRAKPEGNNNTACGFNSMNFAKGKFVSDNSAFGCMSLVNLNGVDIYNGTCNSAFGKNAGMNITSGNNNTLVGTNTGASIADGNNNTLIGKNADASTGASSYRTAIGADSVVEQDNSIVLGRVSDFVGIGTTKPDAKLHVVGNSNAVHIDGGLKVKLQANDTFSITDDSMPDNVKFGVTPTQISTEIPINMNNNEINNLSAIKFGSGTDNYFVKSNGTLDQNSYLTSTSIDITNLQNKTQNITATPTSTTLTNNVYSTCTDATTINYKLPTYGILDQVLSSNGNGSLKWTTPLSSTYPTIATLTGNFTFNGVNCGFTAQRVSIAGAGIVSIFLGGFDATVPSGQPVGSGAWQSSNSPLTVGFRAINAVFVPMRVTKNGTIYLGTLVIYNSGEIGLFDLTQTAGFWQVGDTGGLTVDTAITYPITSLNN